MVLLSLDYSEPSKNLTKLDGNGETFQEEKPLPEEEPLKPQQDILHATENAEQDEEKERLVDFGLYPVPINEDISPVQVINPFYFILIYMISLILKKMFCSRFN